MKHVISLAEMRGEARGHDAGMAEALAKNVPDTLVEPAPLTRAPPIDPTAPPATPPTPAA